jgi:hypothetical protein
MGPHHDGNAIDLPDPWDTSTGDTIPGSVSGGENDEELISRLAGDDVERLIGGRALPQQRGGTGPVQELTSQLDQFFAELRQKQTETIQALARQDEGGVSGGLVIDDAERQALVGDLQLDDPLPPSELQASPAISPHRLFIDAEPAPAWYARPLHWGGGMIESLSPAARILVSLTAILSFLAAGAALVYVLILRQG